MPVLNDPKTKIGLIKTNVVMNWIRYTQEDPANPKKRKRDFTNPPQFYLPDEATASSTEEQEENSSNIISTHKICKSAFGYLLNFKEKPWIAWRDSVAKGTIPQHGLKGKIGN